MLPQVQDKHMIRQPECCPTLRNSKFLLSDNVRIADSNCHEGRFSSFDLNRSVRGSPLSRSFNPREKVKIKSIPDVTGSSELLSSP